jgi:Calcineurin-like phosphoesterase
MDRTVVVGDIHGCYEELLDLMDRIGPAAGDRVISVGDLVTGHWVFAEPLMRERPGH